MANVFPSSLIYRENPNLRLGIKSSLNSFIGGKTKCVKMNETQNQWKAL